jgi:trans-2,3-dihydro-3-hydroxyanthranilate isomerase
MRSYRYLHLDVFTNHLFGGNQLAVVLDGRGLDARTMQAIAKEMNFSETTFVLPPERTGTDVRVRIFTPGEELPMAGHPTIGTAFALARSGMLEPDRSAVVFGLGVGPTDVALAWHGDRLSFAWMTQLAPSFGNPIADRAAAAAALGLALADLAPALPVQLVTCGVPYVLVPLATRAAVDAASLDAAVYRRLQASLGLGPEVCVYLFSTDAAADRATAYARMFGPSIGIGEDPATGSAAGPLAGYLLEHQVVTPATAAQMIVLQGFKMGRPSTIHTAASGVSGSVGPVRVGGEAIVAGEGILYIGA